MAHLISRLIFLFVIIVFVVLMRNSKVNNYFQSDITSSRRTFNIYGTTDAILSQEFTKNSKFFIPILQSNI